MMYHAFWLDVVKCKKCKKTITVPDCLRLPKYICSAHSQTKQDVYLQREQFCRELQRGKKQANFYKTPPGTQVFSARIEEIDVPDWANSDAEVNKLLDGAFPNRARNAEQEFRAKCWATVIYLYYRVRYTETEIAEQTDLTVEDVHGILNRVRRRSKGVRADGTATLSRKPSGRPKNPCTNPNLFIESDENP